MSLRFFVTKKNYFYMDLTKMNKQMTIIPPTSQNFTKIIFIFIYVIFFIAIDMQAQTEKPFGELANSQSVAFEFGQILNDGPNKISYGFNNTYKGINGHPFYRHVWQKGKICLAKNENVIENDVVRYKFDAYKNELWIWNGKDSLIMNSRDIKWFALQVDSGYQYFNKYPQLSRGFPENFFLELYRGKQIILVKDVQKKVKRSDYVDKGMYTTGDPNDRLIDAHKYLISIKNSTFIKIKPTVKSISVQLDDLLKKKCQNFAKKRRWKNTLDDDKLKALLNYLDEEYNKST